MLTLLILGCAGFASGFILSYFGIAVLSFLIFLAWATASIHTQSFDTANILILFAYLTAIQGGYLLGLYVKHSK